MKKIENQAFFLVWLGVFVLEALVTLVSDMKAVYAQAGFGNVLHIWLMTLPFFVLCTLHNCLLAPQWVVKGKPMRYLLITCAAFGLFTVFVCQVMAPPVRVSAAQPFWPFMFMFDDMLLPPELRQAGLPFNEHPMRPAVLYLVIGALMLCVNIGVQFAFKGIRERERMKDLEKENLKYRLDYLRYQISPHFFMNTLNNIHSLVDIDSRKAKSAIVELSRLMRHLLYDSQAALTPLGVELEFLEHYMALMRLRYTDRVRIDTYFPNETTDALVPPLILVTFVENAFKHGVSDEGDSSIRISVLVRNGRVVMNCSNSIATEYPESGFAHGVGLDNVKKRLQLLYGDDFQLKTETLRTDDGNRYELRLEIPAQPAV